MAGKENDGWLPTTLLGFLYGTASLVAETKQSKYQSMVDAAKVQADLRQTASTDQNVDAQTDQGGMMQRDLSQNLLFGFSQVQVISGLFVMLVGLLAVKAYKG